MSSTETGTREGQRKTHSGGTVVLVDDEATTRAIMRGWLESVGYTVVEMDCGARALGELPEDVVAMCLDLGLDDIPGLHVLRHLRARNADLPVLVVTSNSELETAVSAMRNGAQDYLVKPLNRSHAIERVRHAIEVHKVGNSVRSMRAAAVVEDGTPMVGRSTKMRELATQVDRVVDSDVTVCIFGESGTGKEVVARSIHARGRRSRGPFVAINCAAIPHSLQESDLFGHERGSFTGAGATHRGRFEQANEGTLFLDELGEMSPATQAALLRTLQERSIRRVGGSTEIPVNVRIIGATHRDLAAQVEAGKFREDLYFRLVVFPIVAPPLRDRIDDIPLLISHFLQKLRPDVGRDIRRVSADALTAMTLHRWSGNVRELENIVHRAMLASDGDEIALHHLPPEIRSRVLPSMPTPKRSETRLVAAGDGEPVLRLRELEKQAISRAMATAGGSVSKAARLLGMGRATLYRRLAAMGIEVERPDEVGAA